MNVYRICETNFEFQPCLVSRQPWSGLLLGFFWLTPLGESSEEEKINEISPTIFMSVKASIQLNPCFVWVSGKKIDILNIQKYSNVTSAKLIDHNFHIVHWCMSENSLLF